MSYNRKIEIIKKWVEDNLPYEFKTQTSSYKSPITFSITTNKLETKIIFEPEFINAYSEADIQQGIVKTNVIQLFHHNLGKTICILGTGAHVMEQ